MNPESVPKQRTQRKAKLGDKIRNIADKLKEETEVQIKATSRILGVAAQISENYDKLLNEVVDMVEEDLNQQLQINQKNHYTANILKHKFKTLSEAKAHFQLKANSWESLAKKLNEPVPVSDLRNNCKSKVKQGHKSLKKVNITLDPDVAEVFPNSEVVNTALRSLIMKKNNL